MTTNWYSLDMATKGGRDTLGREVENIVSVGFASDIIPYYLL